MKESIDIAAELIKSQQYSWLDDVFETKVPNEYDTKDKTIVICREAESEPGRFANNRFTSWHTGVEVQIFYSLDFDQSTTKCEITINRLFEANGYFCTQNQPHQNDPDTDQVYKTMQFDRTDILKEDK